MASAEGPGRKPGCPIRPARTANHNYRVPVTLADAVPLPSPEPRRPRRRAAAVAGIVGIVAVVGGGAWAWQMWAAQGPQPAEALPADTLAYVAVDLDPPGGQKVAAYRVLKKVPSLEKELGLGSEDDLRQSLVESLAEDGGCDLPWGEVESWAGERGALAVVPMDEPKLVVALQVADPDRARAGLEKVGRSCGEDQFGFAVGDGWAVLAESEEVARQVQAEAEDANLAGDADFKELTDAAGDPGVVTLYAAPEAGQALLDVAEEDPFVLFALYSPLGSLDPVSSLVSIATFLSGADVFESEAGVGYDADGDAEPDVSPEEAALLDRMEKYDELSPAEQRKLDRELEDFYTEKYGAPDGAMAEEEVEDEFAPEIPEATRTALEDFSGLGGTARFDDVGVELEIVADPFLTGYDQMYDGTAARDAIAALPADTAVAFGAGFADGWAKHAIAQDGAYTYVMTEAEMLRSFEQGTGLSPADLEDLGGDAVAFAAKEGFVQAIENDSVEDLAVAARVTGDPEAIEAALAKARAKDDVAEFLKWKRTDDGVVIGPNEGYLAELVDPATTLGDTERFEDAVVAAEDAVAITYADFGAGDWLPFLLDDALTSRDVAALSTFGLSVVEDGDRSRYLARLTFD